jgi:hypothetical protein
LTLDFHIFDFLSSLTESASQTSNQVDLFGESLIGDLMDAPPSVPTQALVMNGNSAEVDLFADAAFVSAPPQAGKEASSQTQVRYLAILISGNEMLCFSFGSCMPFQIGESCYLFDFVSTKKDFDLVCSFCL